MASQSSQARILLAPEGQNLKRCISDSLSAVMEIPNISTQMSKTAWDIYFLLRMKNLEQAVSINSNLCNLSTSTREAKIWITFHNSHFFSSNPKATLIFKAEADLNNLKIFQAVPSPTILQLLSKAQPSLTGEAPWAHLTALLFVQLKLGLLWVQP